MRLDKFLKVSRLIKRRAVANDACDASRVDVNGRPAKPSKELKVGDRVTVRFGEKALSFEVLSIAPAIKKEDAEAMYKII
ncbi:MAG: RNA-binding S4 domain-containing protein [Clostridiales bacterium]|jgi:ribosomal 50S subunit-recycling heat shock protein|nr:RNA-binding S4 domain-containing protein [Clostridiales bacterium]